jgi:hypothetical protein
VADQRDEFTLADGKVDPLEGEIRAAPIEWECFGDILNSNESGHHR